MENLTRCTEEVCIYDKTAVDSNDDDEDEMDYLSESSESKADW